MLSLLSRDSAKRLTSFFREANYTQGEVRDRLGLRELPSRRLGNLPYLMERTKQPGVFHTLVRWFFVGVPVPIGAARQQIPESMLALLVETGLLAVHETDLVSQAMLAPFEQYLVASDPMLKAESAEHSDLVLWPNPTTWLLFRFTIRKPFLSALDLGTGCGMQALAAAAHSARVTGTDLNARAINFAEFNARLNGIEGIEFLTGDTFAPVARRAFDLIISNPPFFVSPFNRDMFCDNSMDLDEYCRALVRDGSSHLNENGFLQIVCEWVQVQGQGWEERLTEWMEGTGCDAWVFKGYTEDPSEYAQKRIRETSLGPKDTDESTYSRWMQYYQRMRVVAVHGGMIALRRRSGQNWIRWQDVAATPKEPFGDFVLRGFENRDFLDAHRDEQLLNQKPALSPDAQLIQSYRQQQSGWETASLRLHLARGIPASIGIQPLVAGFIAQCDGSRAVRDLIRDLAEKVNASGEQVEKECLQIIRKLLEQGFLLPSSTIHDEKSLSVAG